MPRAASRPPRRDSTELHLLGLEALETGDIDAAYEFARQAFRQNADDPQLIFLMAMVLAERHRFAEAIEMLEGVAETTPQARLPALGHTADWLVRYGRWEEAEVRYRQILDQAPDAVLAHRGLAGLLSRQGRRMEAHVHLNRLCYLGDITENELRSMLRVSRAFTMDVDGDRSDPVGPLGVARTEIARGDWRTAQNRLQTVESPGPYQSGLLGRAHAALEDLASLRTWIAEAGDAVDVSPDAWFAKGILAMSAGRPADATRCFAETVRLDPTDADAYSEMARSLAESDASTEAETARRRAELVKKSHDIGMNMAGSDERDLGGILELSELLAQLGRPFESLGWRGVWLSYADATGSVSAAEAQGVLDGIVKHRTMLLEQGQTNAPMEFVLCGVDLAKLPSRQEVNDRMKSLTFDRVP